MTDVEQVRLNCNEPASDSDFSDEIITTALSSFLDNVNYASAQIWRLKASAAADLVDSSEGNSRRSWSKSYQQALDMAAEYQRLGDEDKKPVSVSGTAITRGIVRL